jgi:hypothetical protein
MQNIKFFRTKNAHKIEENATPGIIGQNEYQDASMLRKLRKRRLWSQNEM